MGIIDRIEGAAYTVVATGALEWRIRRVRSSDLARAGNAQLLAMLTPVDMGKIQEVSASEAAQLLMDKYRNLTDPQLHRMATSQEALVCAGVVAVRAAGSEEWREITIHPTKPSSDPDGILSVQSLADPHKKALSEAIMAHSVDEGGLREAIQGFQS